MAVNIKVVKKKVELITGSSLRDLLVYFKIKFDISDYKWSANMYEIPKKCSIFARAPHKYVT